VAKLWDKGERPLDALIEKFTVGDDYLLDRALVRADVLGSVAHAKMLAKIAILTEDEFERVKQALKEVLALEKKGHFVIEPADEDVHTRIENHLTERLGDLGKKIHTARSRNDQVLVDLRLYTKEQLFDIEAALLALAASLLAFARKHTETPMPGRTHMQIAMPSSVGLWAAAHTEALLDDLVLLRAAFDLNDQCPLGSAASYGSALPIDRRLTSDLLGFAKVQNNVLYANNSRGKVEAAVISALAEIMVTLSKMATDLIIFSMPEFAYFSLPAELCTGSSLMPQKKNPCGLELVRAKSATVIAHLNQVLGTICALPSGYNRDFQETKRPLMQAIEITLGSLGVMKISIERLEVKKDNLLKGFVPEIYATDRVGELVADGVPFRDAYREVAKNLDKLGHRDPVENIKSKTHIGASGNLGLEISEKRVREAASELTNARQAFDACIEQLLK